MVKQSKISFVLMTKGYQKKRLVIRVLEFLSVFSLV